MTDAQEQLLLQEMSFIRGFVARNLRDHCNDVDDVVQNICEQCCVSIHNLRDPAKFHSWIGGIAYHEICNYYRNFKRERAIPCKNTRLLGRHTEPDTGWIELDDLLSKLNYRQRKTMQMRLAGLSYSEIGATFGIGCEGARSVCRRAIDKIRREVLDEKS